MADPEFHAGLNRSGYPGDAVMEWLWLNTNLAWTAVYLAPAPSHQETSWMTRVPFLRGLGWGFAPVYVGQQATGPGSHLLTTAQGRLDAQQAAALALVAGFPPGSILFLDVEQGPPATPATIEYYRAWAREVFDATLFYPGVYCSYLGVAQALHAAYPTPYVWVFHLTHTCDPTEAGLTQIPSSTTIFPTPNPASSGFPLATVWQYVQSNRPASVCSIPVVPGPVTNWDFNSAVALDPSTPASYP